MRYLHNAHLREIERKKDRGPWPPDWLTPEKTIAETKKELTHSYSFLTQMPHDTPDRQTRKLYIIELMSIIWRELEEGWPEE